jgi:glycosyltransferase involved in cell wall biosynthesis
MKAWLNENIKNFDVLHLHDFRSYQNYIASRYASKYQVPYIVQAHGDIPYLQKRVLKKLYDSVWGNKIIQHASNLFALTELEKGQYITIGANVQDITIVPNGIDFSHYKELPEPGSFRKKHRIREDEKIVLYLGRLHKTKGIELLITAYKKILDRYPKSRLVLIGPDDGNRNNLIKQIDSYGIHSHVMFLGFIDDAEKKMALVDADVFVTPRYSGYPITFLEACACGVPIITTDSGDPIDWINNNYGYVVKYDQNELSAVIANTLSNSNIKKEIAAGSRTFVYNNFDWEVIASRIVKIYGSIIRTSTGKGDAA